MQQLHCTQNYSNYNNNISCRNAIMVIQKKDVHKILACFDSSPHVHLSPLLPSHSSCPLWMSMCHDSTEWLTIPYRYIVDTVTLIRCYVWVKQFCGNYMAISTKYPKNLGIFALLLLKYMSYCFKCTVLSKARSSAVTGRPWAAPCYWKFC